MRRASPPPPRYRIVERNRRLVVVDNWADGGPVGVSAPSPVPGVNAVRPALPGRMTPVAFDGRTAFITHALFDDKGPRTVILDPASAATINGIRMALVVAAATIVFVAVVSPYLLIVPLVVLVQPKLRKGIRRTITAWLDRAAVDTA